MTPITAITVGVRDLDRALGLWAEALGFEVLLRRDGSDAELSRLWGLAPDAVARQALLGTPGAALGRLHLVEFTDPAGPVREGAEPFDLCPKNLDLYSRDLPARQRELRQQGYAFRSDWVQFEVEGLQVREVHMAGHDRTNVVLLELLGKSYPFTDQGYAGIAALVTVVPDAEAETRFWQEVMGLELKSSNLLEGLEIETMIGLPPGSGLDVRILGRADDPFGQIELVEYRGVEGRDLYPRSRPPALGTLHVSVLARDLDALERAARDAGVSVRRLGLHQTAVGQGEVLELRTPAGFRIEVYGGGASG